MRERFVAAAFRAALLLLAAFIGGFRLDAAENATPSAAGPRSAPETDKLRNEDDYYDLLKLFTETLDQVERNYVKDVSRRELIEAAIKGMLSKLDEHTNYVSPQDIDRFRTGVESEFAGIGVQLSVDPGKLTVVAAIPDSPAQRAGIATGDIITRINGSSTDSMLIDDAVKQLKGKSGTKLTVSVLHLSTGKEEELSLTRDLVRVETVRGIRRTNDRQWEYFCDREAGIAYVRITAFGRHTADELRSVIEKLISLQMKGLVLDLRFNPGGLLSTAVDVADLFVTEGRIVSMNGRNAEEQVWNAKKEGTFAEFPLAVLVNQYSASASEIVAACLQDHGRAGIVGQRTLGKGSVQNIVELEGGRSALKLTTAGYHRPSGRNIDRHSAEGDGGQWGVQPDTGCEVSLTEPETRGLYVGLNQREQAGVSADKSPDLTLEDKQFDRALTLVRQRLAASSAEPAGRPAEPMKTEPSGGAKK